MSPSSAARAENEAPSSISSAEGAHDEARIGAETGQFTADHAAQGPRERLRGARRGAGRECLASRALLAIAREPSAGAGFDGQPRRGALGVVLRSHLCSARHGPTHRADRLAQPSGRDAPLPSLGPITLPEVPVEKVLGPAPEVPPISHEPSGHLAAVSSPVAGSSPPAPKSPAEIALERRLAGPAFSRRSESDSGPGTPTSTETNAAIVGPPGGPVSEREPGGGAGSGALQELLRPSLTPAVRAQVLPTQRLLLPKGAFIDCTLETAIDSTLPGMTTCITATDTFSADGSTVLMERGTKLVGETRGEVAQGARAFLCSGRRPERRPAS